MTETIENINHILLELEKAPTDISLLYHLATSYEKAGDYKKAIQTYQSIIQLDSSIPNVFFNLGNILIKIGQSSAGINAITLSIKVDPKFLPGYKKLAVLFENNRQPEKAENIYKEALNILPDSQELKNDYALFLKRIDRLEESELIFRNLILQYPNIPKYHGNLANILQRQLKLKKAMEHYNFAIELEPNYFEALFSRSLAHLLNGDYNTGWKDYEWRWKLPYFNMKKRNKPLWTGQNLKGKRLLVWAEQGFGDTIQMYRFLVQLKELGIYTIFECQQELFDLFQINKISDELKILDSTDEKEFDFHIPMMSLPYRLKTNISNIPSSSGYLNIDANENNFDVEKSKLNIGIVWKGNVKFSNDANRSVNLNHFSSLMQNKSIQLYSLQYGKNETLQKYLRIIDLSDRLHHFLATAEVVSKMDIIISVDTAVAHLAGAMGKNTWLLLPYYPDWRWGLDQQTSVWYDSVKIFRQHNQGDWNQLFKDLEMELSIQN